MRLKILLSFLCLLGLSQVSLGQNPDNWTSVSFSMGDLETGAQVKLTVAPDGSMTLLTKNTLKETSTTALEASPEQLKKLNRLLNRAQIASIGTYIIPDLAKNNDVPKVIYKIIIVRDGKTESLLFFENNYQKYQKQLVPLINFFLNERFEIPQSKPEKAEDF